MHFSKKNRFMGLFISGLVLSGCSAIPLKPGAGRVLVSPNPPEKSCKFVAMIQGSQGNFFTGDYTSNANLQEGAMNDLRNKAFELGANYVQLITNRASSTFSGGGTGSGFGASGQQTGVLTSGNAYKCPDQ